LFLAGFMPSVASGISYNYATTPTTMVFQHGRSLSSNSVDRAAPYAKAAGGEGHAAKGARTTENKDMELEQCPSKAAEDTPVPSAEGVPGDIKAAMAQAMEENRVSFQNSVYNGVKGPLEELCKSVATSVVGQLNTRMDGLEDGQKKLVAGQASLESGQAAMLASLQKLEKRLETMSHSKSEPSLPEAAQSATPADGGSAHHVPVASGFWRVPNPVLMFSNIQDGVKVQQTAFVAVLLPLLADANVQDSEVSVVSDELDNRFDLTFIGPSAAAKCLQFQHSLYLGRGKHKEVFVDAPDGSSNKAYFNPDKSQATVRKEMLSKQMRDVISALLPSGKEAFARRSTGSVMVDRRVLCTITMVNEGKCNVAWNHAKRIEFKIEEDVAMESFLTGAGLSP